MIRDTHSNGMQPAETDNSHQSECKVEDRLSIKSSGVYAQIKSYQVTTVHKKASRPNKKASISIRDNAERESKEH